jgi:membrane fusion protein (multidrug efflux system)
MDEHARHDLPARPGRLFTLGGVAAVVLIVVAAAALVLARDLRIRRQAEGLDRDLARGPHVLVTRPNQVPPTRTVEVPATVHGFVETPIYAKVAGYVRSVSADKGDRVAAGRVLAALDAPELDQQVAHARADYELRAVTDRRTEELARQGIVARQAADEARGAMRQAKATLEQLEAMQAYEEIRAPFAGVVTERNVDPGTLVPQSTAAAGTPLFTMATLAPVRVYADVPQTVATTVRLGDPAVITVAEYPGREFAGTVTRRADALQPQTRTMRIEIDVPNDDTALYPGMYAHVALTVARRGGTPQVPDDALVFRDGKVYVPLVRDGRLHLAEVALGYDDGRMVEVTSGVAPDDLIAVNVGQAARDGEPVQPVPAERR